MIKKLFIIAIALLSGYSYSQTVYEIDNPNDIEDLILTAGDVVILENGTYDLDTSVNIYGEGTSSEPVTFKAESPGGVLFTNTTKFAIGGKYVIVDGFHWKGGVGVDNFIQFRAKNPAGGSAIGAQNCTLQNCVLDGLVRSAADIAEDEEKNRMTKHNWVTIFGTNNTVINCAFMNKTNAGNMVLAELRENDACDPIGHTISNNFFYNYKKVLSTLGNANDSEAIRIGTSGNRYYNAACVISNNYFLEANGENEIISNKSSNNTYENNTFRRCKGSLVLRHGAGATVNRNYFLGENVDGTGGLRIVDSEHTITNNYIQDCVTVIDQAKWNNGLTFMGGSQTSSRDCDNPQTSNGYQKCENNYVGNNTIINTNAPLFYNGNKGTTDNTGTVTDNLIYFEEGNSRISDVISEDASGEYKAFGESLAYLGNIFGGTDLGIDNDGFSEEIISVEVDGEIFSHDQEGKGADMGGFKPHTDAMVGYGIGACFLDVNGAAISNPICEIVELDKLKVAALSKFDIKGGSQDVVLDTNVAWTATIPEGLDWLSFTPSSDTGESDSVIEVIVTENPSDTPRSGIITFSQDAGELFAKLEVTQVGAEINIDPISEFSVEAGSKTIIVDANVAWAATSSLDWVTISPSSGDGEGDDSVMITVSENPNTSVRSGVITFNQVADEGVDGVLTELAVSQEAQDAADVFNLINDLGIDDHIEVHSFSKQQVGPDGDKIRENYAKNSLDKDEDSVWAADDTATLPDGELKGDGEYIIYDLGFLYTLDLIRLRTNKDKDHSYGYQILVSNSDAEDASFTQIIPAADDNLTGNIMLTEVGSGEFQQNEVAVDARYVKLVGFGRFNADVTKRESAWTNIAEIEFFGTTEDPASDDDFVFSETVIYPVPANDFITLNNYKDLNKVEVLSLEGKLLLTQNVQEFDSNIKINTSGLSNGIYLLKLSNSTGVSGTRKIVIQH